MIVYLLPNAQESGILWGAETENHRCKNWKLLTGPGEIKPNFLGYG